MTDVTTVREIERKLSVDAAFKMPDLLLSGAPVVIEQRTVVLNAAYYDTEDLRLARFGVTLRRRTGGDDAGWHLKLPSDMNAPDERHELQLPLKAGGPGKVPAELSVMVLGLTRGEPLAQRATQRTRRAPTLVGNRDDAIDLEVVDDNVTIATGPLAGLKYREVEVEVVGSDQRLSVVVDLLLSAGAGPATSTSKGVRAVAGDAPIVPVLPEVERARPTDSAAHAVTQHLRTHIHALVRQDVRVRRGLPDSVHQFRVAARRLRSGLQAFAPLVHDDWARQLRDELGWIAGVFGAARDREVLEDRMFEAIRRLPGDLDRAAALVAVQDHLQAQLTTAHEQVSRALQSQRYLVLLDTLVAAAVQPPTTELAERPASEMLPPLVRKRWKRLAREANMLHDEVQGHDDHWHKTRITAKKARYSVEACVPVFGGPARKLAKQLEKVTEMLGEHQDCAMAADAVRSILERDTGPQTSFALGALYAQQRERTQQIRQEFIAEWPKISHNKWRKWLKSKGSQ